MRVLIATVQVPFTDGNEDGRNAAELLVGDALAVVRKLRDGLFPDFPADEKPKGDEP